LQAALRQAAEQLQAEWEASEKQFQALEARHGDVLDMLDKQGVIELIRSADPESAQFHLQRLARSGLGPTLRLLLLEHLESALDDREKIGEPSDQLDGGATDGS